MKAAVPIKIAIRAKALVTDAALIALLTGAAERRVYMAFNI